MANEQPPRSPTALFNPFWLWADMGMRATEMAVASSQNITEGADRVTRAVAGTEANEIVAPAHPDASPRAGAWPAATWEGMASMQRLAWDLMAQGWARWLSTAGSLVSASAGAGLPRQGARVMGATERALAADSAKPHRKAAAKPSKARRATRPAGRTGR